MALLFMTKLSGIDVSHYQGDINWKAVKEYGIDFIDFEHNN